MIALVTDCDLSRIITTLPLGPELSGIRQLEFSHSRLTNFGYKLPENFYITLQVMYLWDSP
jgi:hypothetical protein